MAFKITKTEHARVASLTANLDRKREEINEKLNEVRTMFEQMLEDFNETREELRGFIEDIISEKESDFEDKSDNWRDGDRGQATEAWIESLRDVETALQDDLEVEIPEDIEFPDELRTLLDEGLPSEPEY
jgi:hypothetical protein